MLPLLLFALSVHTPDFGSYPAATTSPARLALPHIHTPEERRFHTTLKQAITKGYNVVDGGTEHERVGPNFAGSMVLVQWGCGTSCMQGAVIDTRNGMMFSLPRVPGEEGKSEFASPAIDLQTLQFRTNSRLLAMPNVSDTRTYYFVLEGHRWSPAGSTSAAQTR